MGRREREDRPFFSHPTLQTLPDSLHHRAIDSIADAYTVVTQNVRPCKRMLTLLKENFDPNKADGKFSLQLKGSSRGGSSYGYGMGRFGFGGGGGGGNSSGATLSHSHDTQWTFVWQTLCLWVKVSE